MILPKISHLILNPEKSGFLRALDFKSESFGFLINKRFEICSFDYPFKVILAMGNIKVYCWVM